MTIKRVSFLLFFVLTAAMGQEKNFVLEWEDKELSYSNLHKVKVHGFQDNYLQYDESEKKLFFVNEFTYLYPVDENNVEVLKVNYENVTSSSLFGLETNNVSSDLGLVVKNTSARGKNKVYVSFNPIVSSGQGFKKVKSITLKFRPGNSIGSNFRSAIVNSEMATGEWYKFYVTESGVHKLSRSFLSSLGVDVSGVNPQNIRLFGRGGKSIPLRNADVLYNDVVENAIQFVGEQDGVLNENDYLLFYASGITEYDRDNFSHINPYTDKTYYYINVSSVPGRRIAPMVEPVQNADHTITTFHEYQYHEVDEVNIVKVGRRWYGEDFGINATQNFSFSFPRKVASEPIRLTVHAAGVAANNTNAQIQVNGQELEDNNVNFDVPELNFSPITDITLARADFYEGDVTVNSNDLNVSISYFNLGNPSANMYLDYVAVEAESDLRSLGKQFRFANNTVSALTGVGEYRLNDANDVTAVWDVTNPVSVQYKENNQSGLFNFKSTMGEDKEYVALVGDDFLVPKKDEGSAIVGNSNLKGTIFTNSQGEQEDIDYLVITPARYRAQAEQLAQINAQNLRLRTRVVNLEDVYTEFNTGNPDIGAVRNFVKYVYDNPTTDPLQFLCLMGDASFDMKDRVRNNTNLFPTYHTLPSFSLASSFMSDDFYGMMDANEGTMLGSDKLDIAVGRMVFYTAQQANEMVNKVRQYYEKESYGSWRNDVVVVSDDIDVAWEAQIQSELNAMADDIVANQPLVNVKKIHTDAYVQETSAGGELYPKAKEELINKMDFGVLAATYFGHGGEDGLAQERIFQKVDGENLTNICRYNLFVTVTCDYTKFDNPLRQTAGEFVYWNPKGGAVNLITTTREIYIGLGINFNKTLAEYLYSYDVNEDVVYAGEALRRAKNDLSDGYRRVVFCVGDPALRLAIPKPGVRLTHINDVAITDPSVPVLEALGKVKLRGEVVDANGVVVTNPSGVDLGVLSTVIFDKKQNRETLGNDGTTNSSGVIKMNFETQGETVFRGQSTIKSDGTFEFEFVVSRDISIPVGEGRVSFYANMAEGLNDYSGYNNEIEIGGLNTNAPADNLGPTVVAFMNDDSFVSGGTTGQSPLLLLRLEDDNGINTASGVGHDITAVLDGDEANPFVLNDYYQTEPDDFTKGKLSYQFRDLESGLHTLTIKAWDVYNNSSTTEIQFVVVNENQELLVEKVLNYPNPFVSYTEFWFTHNSSTELDVMVQVYTVSGKLVKTIRGTTAADNKGENSSLSRNLTWDGRDDFGEKIGKGVYVYKLTVSSPVTQKTSVKYEKLVIL